MGKAFAMRLMHLGLTVYVDGRDHHAGGRRRRDTRRRHLRVRHDGRHGACRGGARGAGAAVHAVTTDPASPLAEVADAVLVLPAATKYRRADEAPTIQPL